MNSIDDNYVDGVSITVSITTKTIPRQHIWTYAAGVTDSNMGCPCNNNTNVMVPDHVGSNYYCESGTSTQLDCDAEFNRMTLSGMVYNATMLSSCAALLIPISLGSTIHSSVMIISN